jgi:hypothetical protein
MRAGDAVTIGPPMRLWRVYRQGGAYPSGWSDFRFDGPTGSRFDHHVPPRRHQDRGILYAASQRSTDAAALNSALAEVFQDTRTIDPYDRSPWLAGFVVTATLRLLHLGSGWMTRAGGNAALTSGGRRVAQEWSRKIHADVDVDGLWYPCATYPPGRAVALYERAAEQVPAHPVFHRPLSDPGLRVPLRHAGEDLGYDLIE